MEKQYELRVLSSSGSDENENHAVYVKAPEYQEFELIDDPNRSQSSETKPNQYYEFLENVPQGRIKSFLSFMRDFELKNNESAGLKYALIASFLLALVGTLKISVFSHIAFINFIYIQFLVSFGVCYLFCRTLDLTPYLEDEEKQTNLKISGVLYLIGGLIYLYSWDFWPRQYSHFVLAVFPFALLIRETVTNRNNIQVKELLFFGLNLIGMYVLLAIPDTYEDFSLAGLGLSLIAVGFLFLGFFKMQNANGNMISTLSVYLLILDIFIPGFFAIQNGGKPGFLEVIGMLLISFISFVGFIFATRSIQISKSSHIFLFASLGLAIVNFGRGLKSDGLTFEGIIGTVLSFFGAILILINQSKRTEHMDYDKTIAMIG